MKTKILIPLLFLFSMGLNAQDVLKLQEGESPGKGSLQELDWLIGYWKGTGLGGDCDELWMPAVDNSMSGIFRFAKEGRINITEYIVIEEIGESLSIRLKHFNRDLSPWEEKDKWVEFKFIKIDDQTAYFHGLTYHREGDTLTIKLSLKSNEESWIEEFRFEKTLL